MADDPRSAWLHATELSPAAVARVRARLAAPSAPSPAVRPIWVTSVAVAATIVGVATFFAYDPPAVLPLPNVTLEISGTGQVHGTRSRPEIRLENGRVTVEVEPDRGVHLTVTTAEAHVEVVGTAFVVERSHHATSVRVSHGTVQVSCAGAEAVPLSTGEITCLPVDAPTLVMRLVELGSSAAEDRLTTADRALSAAESSLRPEILAHRVQALIDLGRTEAAVAAAEEYLATGEKPRREALIQFVARTRYTAEQCGALDALERAADELPPGQERLLLASCLIEQDPVRAKALTEGAETWATGAWLELALRIRHR